MKIIRNILALVGGIVGGGILNYMLVILGHTLTPMDGYVEGDMESLAIALENATPTQLIFPFIAHAVGTLVGSLIAYIIAASSKKLFAYIVGIWFLLNGIYMVYVLGGPLWFTVLDLIVAYIPMAYLAILIGKRIQPEYK
jgi:hypothetical protein